MPTNRQMTLVAFLQAQNCSNFPASWRHPAAAQDFMTAEYYQRSGNGHRNGACRTWGGDCAAAGVPDTISGLLLLPIIDPPVSRRVGILTRRDKPVRGVAARLMRHIRSTLSRSLRRACFTPSEN
jgi:hypothetical protein